MTRIFFLFRMSAIYLIVLGASPAMAILGQAASKSPATTPSMTSARLKAAVPAAPSALYTAHQIQLESGVLITEFIRPDGVVFALAWQGPVLPDLSVLLGGYFTTFKAEIQRTRLAGQRNASVSMALDGLVVKSSGRMRHFFGSAYAIDLIPAGVNINDVLQ
jgi:hypothetical protein